MSHRAFKVVLAFASPLLLFALWMFWDVHEVTSFCEDVHQGALLTALPQLADQHGISRHWLDGSVPDARRGDWVFFVPAGSTLGDYSCAVHHNKVAVTSAKTDDMR
jgi:hypothetical protein